MVKATPSVAEFLFDMPLYSHVSLPIEEGRTFVRNLRTHTGALDRHCPLCEKETTFRIAVTKEVQEEKNRERSAAAAMPGPRGERTSFNFWLHSHYFDVPLYCARVQSHVARFYFALSGGEEGDESVRVTKVGQTPSVVDFAQGDFLRFKGELDQARLRELKRAVELEAHGYNIACFVHLRRIFESLVAEARNHEMAERAIHSWPEFEQARMEDKIQLVAHFLPDTLVEHRRVYKRLSKGIHELTEEESGEDLPKLRYAIEVILDERIEAKAKLQRRLNLSRVLSSPETEGDGSDAGSAQEKTNKK